ncbi:MAG: hypothetical protein RL441_592 [Actinomycetota bacterium]
MNLRVYCPAALSAPVLAMLDAHVGVANIAVMAGASTTPVGDLILADVARESANEIVDGLVELGVQKDGGFHLTPVETWVSERGLAAEEAAPGEEADAVVWAQVIAHAYDDTSMSWSYIVFLCLATILASIAIVLDSPILVVGAMVLGPDFGPVAALGLAIVTRRRELLRRALRLIVVGFVFAIGAATLFALAGSLLGWVPDVAVTAPRPGTAFIYHPDRWSIVVAVLAGVAGVLSLTSSSSNALVGVFISVTTVPAAGNIALGLAFGQFDQVRGSALQLLVNIVGMAIAGWLTLLVQRRIWKPRA